MIKIISAACKLPVCVSLLCGEAVFYHFEKGLLGIAVFNGKNSVSAHKSQHSPVSFRASVPQVSLKPLVLLCNMHALPVLYYQSFAFLLFLFLYKLLSCL